MFLAYLFQPNGCDYTIACGYSLIELESTDFDSAVAELRRLVTTDYRGDITLESVTLLQVNQKVAMPVAEWYHEDEQQRAEQARMKNEQQERELYEQLKHKFD